MILVHWKLTILLTPCMKYTCSICEEIWHLVLPRVFGELTAIHMSTVYSIQNGSNAKVINKSIYTSGNYKIVQITPPWGRDATIYRYIAIL